MSALPPVPSDVLSAFRQRPGRALMLGHVHPDADVLGTLLATGLALEKAGWSVVYGGPHPAPASLEFLPGVERYATLTRLEGSFDVALLTDCPNPGRTEGLIDQGVDVARIPNFPAGATTPLPFPRPTPQFNLSDYFVQGISFGVSWRW